MALHRHTAQSRPVAISSSRHRNDLVQCGSGSGETIVVEGGQNLVVRLWGSATKWELTTEAEFQSCLH